MHIMKNFINTVIVIGLYLNISLLSAVESPPTSVPGKFRECSDVWGVVSEYCDAPTIFSLTRVSSKVGVEPRLQLEELRVWKENGRLLIALFGFATYKDLKKWIKLPRWHKEIDTFTFDEYKQLLTGFVRLSLDPEAVAVLSSNINNCVGQNQTLTSSEKALLGLYLPDKTPKELCEALERSILNGGCHCDARLLEDGQAQFSQCKCRVKLSERDLRRITPRILSYSDQIESIDPFITLLFADIEKKNISLFWPMKYRNPALRRVFASKLKEKLMAERLPGSDVMKSIGLFTLFGFWAEVDQVSKLLIQQSESFKDYLTRRSFLAIHTSVTIPIIRCGRFICWLALKTGLVNK
jgi:hypothetical protein